MTKVEQDSMELRKIGNGSWRWSWSKKQKWIRKSLDELQIASFKILKEISNYIYEIVTVTLTTSVPRTILH